MKKILYGIAAVILLLLIAGIIKFNFINDDVYLPDGKGNYLNNQGKILETVEDEKQDFAEQNPASKEADKETENPKNSTELDDEKYFIESFKKIKKNGKEIFIHEIKVKSSKECAENLEKFNSQKLTCYFECDNKKECLKKIKKIENFLLNIYPNDSLKKNIDYNKKSIEEEKSEAIYKIEKNKFYILKKGYKLKKEELVKDWLKVISPKEISDNFLERLIFFRDKDDETGAFIEENQLKPNKWDIFVNLDILNENGEKEMFLTLIHEFSHILTLNKKQLIKNKKNKCPNYGIAEGCLKKDAYLNTFYNKFWKGKKFDPRSDDDIKNYRINPNAFVTEYAATNPAEDIAESLAFFVISPKPKGNLIKDQKIKMFYAYPKLVEWRNKIRSEMRDLVGIK